MICLCFPDSGFADEAFLDGRQDSKNYIRTFMNFLLSNLEKNLYGSIFHYYSASINTNSTTGKCMNVKTFT